MTISTASSAWPTPPVPTTGTPCRWQIWATTRKEMGRMACPDSQAKEPSIGSPVSTSIRRVGPMESMAVTPSAPACKQASTTSSRFGQLAVTLINTGRLVFALATATIGAASSAR